MISWSHWKLEIPYKKASKYVLEHQLFRKQDQEQTLYFFNSPKPKQLIWKGKALFGTVSKKFLER